MTFRIHSWSAKWQLNLNPHKCVALNISNKRLPIAFNYCIGSYSISWSKKVKYLGIILNSKLKWDDQCHYVVNKATQCLNRLRRAMYGCTFTAKAHAYKAIVRPCLEYACTVWSPYAVGDIKMIVSVQHIGVLVGLKAFIILSFRNGLNLQTPVLVNLVSLLFIYEESTFQF